MGEGKGHARRDGLALRVSYPDWVLHGAPQTTSTTEVLACVPDNLGSEAPLWATIISIDPDCRGFTVEWDVTGLLGWQSVDDIDCFQSETEA